MSTSPSRSRVTDTGPVPDQSAPFPYLEVPGGAQAALEGFERGQAVDHAARENRAREPGRQEAYAEAKKKFDEQLASARAAVAAALLDFTRERAAYYQKVEGELVELALSIARKILHREAQVDPLLLAGIVRVALEKIEGATGVVLSVHPQHAAEWRHYFAVHMDPGDIPEILEDAALGLDRCLLQTSMGVTELGMEVQLKEVERGLMDLLAARPGAGA